MGHIALFPFPFSQHQIIRCGKGHCYSTPEHTFANHRVYPRETSTMGIRDLGKKLGDTVERAARGTSSREQAASLATVKNEMKLAAEISRAKAIYDEDQARFVEQVSDVPCAAPHSDGSGQI